MDTEMRKVYDRFRMVAKILVLCPFQIMAFFRN